MRVSRKALHSSGKEEWENPNPGSSLVTGAAKPGVTRCQPGPEFLLRASKVTQEVNSVIHFSLCDKFVMAFFPCLLNPH